MFGFIYFSLISVVAYALSLIYHPIIEKAKRPIIKEIEEETIPYENTLIKFDFF